MDNWDNDPLARKNQEKPAGTPEVPPSHSWEPWKCRAEVWQGRKEQRWGGKRGMEGEAIPCCASLVCNLLGYRNWNSGWDLYKEESKGIGVSFQHVLDFPLIPWHRNSNPALLWGRKIPFPSPLAGILQIGDKPSDSRRLLGWEEAQGCAQTSQGMAPAPCLQQPVAILISVENQPKPSQLSWRFSDVPVMFKLILCLISL